MVAGIGGSWFRYGGDWQWAWQRDFFDLGNATALFLEMIKADALSDGMRRRMERVGVRREAAGPLPDRRRPGAAVVSEPPSPSTLHPKRTLRIGRNSP